MLLIDNRGVTDPAINLAIEEFSVRHLSNQEDYFLLYCNDSSVIIGRHQNHIQEVDLRFCARHDVPVHRRISGGGAVYHDPGNLNFGIVTTKTMQNFNQYHEFLQPVLKALRNQGLNVELDKRNNIVSGGLKLSGNAQFTSRERLLSHGTLLLNADLKILRGALARKKNTEIESRASQSIPASVANASDLLGKLINYNEMKDAIIAAAGDVGIMKFNENQWRHISKLAEEKFRLHHWNLEHSPPCRARKWDDHYIGETEVEKGKIKRMVVRGKKRPNGQVWDLTDLFGGCLYEFNELMDKSKQNLRPRLPFNSLDYLI